MSSNVFYYILYFPSLQNPKQVSADFCHIGKGDSCFLYLDCVGDSGVDPAYLAGNLLIGSSGTISLMFLILAGGEESDGDRKQASPVKSAAGVKHGMKKLYLPVQILLSFPA